MFDLEISLGSDELVGRGVSFSGMVELGPMVGLGAVLE